MKLQVPFLQLPICFDAPTLAAEVQKIPPSLWRPHPQGFPGNDALPLVSAMGDPANEAFSGPMRPTPILRECPYLTQTLAAIGATWGRVRLMRLSGGAEVTSHIDTHYYWRERVRVHVPIITQPSVRFHCGGAEINMKAGECWIFDTWRAHKVINDHVLPRIHLVADTVGGDGFWTHMGSARPHDAQVPDWRPKLIELTDSTSPGLDFEARNAPEVMSPWELKEHLVFFLGEAKNQPELPAVHKALVRMTRRWAALWACHGDGPSGWDAYRDLLRETVGHLTAIHVDRLQLENGLNFLSAVSDAVFSVAVSPNLPLTGSTEPRQGM